MYRKFRIFAIAAGILTLACPANTEIFASAEVNQVITQPAIIDLTTYDEAENVTKNEKNISISEGGWVKFVDVNFGEGLEHVVLHVSTETEIDPSSVKVYIDSMDNAIAEVAVEMLPGQAVDFRALGADFTSSVAGVHDVYIHADTAVKLEWAKFTNVVKHEIGNLTGSALAVSVQKAIDSLNPYDVLQLDGATYEMGRGNLKITDPMTLRGLAPTTDAYKTKVGASDISTVFNNIGTITVQTDDVRIEHLEIAKPDVTGLILSVRVDGYPNTTNEKMFTGFVLDNVKLYGGKYSVHTGNGAEVTFTNSTFENFDHHALTLDRRIPVAVNPQLYVDRCYFEPHTYPKSKDSETRQKYRTTDYFVPYNLTAIVIDGGNDEYVIWDLSNTVFSNSTLVNTGYSLAKVANVHMHGNTFIQEFGDVEMIHMEEFTNNVIIENNLFKSITDGDRYTSMGIGIDREMQSTFDIIFRDNTIEGGYSRFFNAYAPQGITIENNDFSNAYSQSIKTPNGLIADTFFNFTWNALEHHLDNMPDVGAKNVIIKDNIFNPDTMERYKMTVEEYDGETTNYFQPDLIIDKTILASEPEPYIPVNESYRILNKATGQYLHVKPGDEKIYYTAEPLDDGSDIWHLEQEQSIYYSLKNQKEDKYLEVKLPFTAAHMDNNTKPAEVHAKIISDYAEHEFVPMWFFVEEVIDGVKYMLMHPGYSECRSRLTQAADVDHAFTEVARISDPASYKPFDDEDLWEFIPLDGTRMVPHSETAKLETAIAPISFEAGEVVSYKVTGASAAAAIVAGEGVTDGAQAIAVTMLERQDDVANAAKLILAPADVAWDLGVDQTMYLSITNPNNFRAQIRVTLSDAHGNERGLYFWLEPEATENIEIGPDLLGKIGEDATKYAGTYGYFDKGVDPTCITQIQIFFPENNPKLMEGEEAGSFIVDNIYGFIK
ncbi:carbohydrate-binding protein [Candidatus Epulonipiscium viviparus]|uniref:carbohydrate-binding protein n=1 Tax=Candidatus Epulonipiscium viviparus TaxID=420336 RepID=UPI002738052A|nr:carbohydrate-binding protein [Candidatus Epulopiscium viviparus]